MIKNNFFYYYAEHCDIIYNKECQAKLVHKG